MTELTPLEAMGFEPDECKTIIDVCLQAQAAGLGPRWNPVDLGHFVMSLRPIPSLDQKNFFVFSLHWREVARYAIALISFLVLMAGLTQ